MEVDTGKKLSALIPVVMSLFALVLALTQLVIQVVTNSVGSTKAAEGALVYVGLLLMAAQLPVIAFFAIRWLRRTPWQAVTVLVVQAIAFAAAAVLPVFEFRW